MKNIKIILFLTTIVFVTSVPFVTEAKDCSHLTKLHEKLICKAGSDIYNSDSATTMAKTKKIKEEQKVSKERGGQEINTIEKLFKKFGLKK